MRKFIVLGALFIIACGGGSAKPPTASFDGDISNLPPSVALACSQAAPSHCGGDIVGTWKFVGICDSGKTQADIIADYERHSQCGVSADMKIGGYMKFRADGTFQDSEEDSFIVNYPETCLKNTTVSCSDICIDCCVSDGTMCTCTFLPFSGMTAGYYATDSSQYHLTNYTGDRADRAYCVQGNTLSIFAPSESVMGSATIVLSRVASSDMPDVDAGPLPGVKYDAAPDVPADSSRSKDAALDKPKADAGIPDAPLEAPRQDAAIDKPKADTAVDKPRIDTNSLDATPIDTQPIDATPLPIASLVPGSVAACQQTASTPCGGDLKGSWKIVGTCDPWLSEAEFLTQINKDCDTASDLNESGLAVFGGDGTCSLDDKLTYQTDYAVSCLSSQLSDTCSAKNTRIQKEIGTKDITDASCALSSAATCRCTNTFDSPAAADVCTYTVSGQEMTFVSPPAAFAADTFDYCVQGNTLSIFIAPTSSAGKACAGCYASFVLVRSDQ